MNEGRIKVSKRRGIRRPPFFFMEGVRRGIYVFKERPGRRVFLGVLRG